MNITQNLHRAVQQKPEDIATICGTRRQTFRQLRERVARVGGMLRQFGMQTDARVGMLALNSDRYLEYLLGTVWAGGAVNPLNIRWSVQELVYAIDDCATVILLVDDAFAETARQVAATAKTPLQLIYVGDGTTPQGMLCYEELIQVINPIDDAARGGDDLAAIIYTGGTTGFPKGVMLSHTNLCMNALGLRASGHGPVGVRFLHAAPMFHIASLAGVMVQLLAGGTHVFLPSFTPAGVFKEIQESHISDAGLVPTMIQLLADYPDLGQYNFSSLRHILYGASPITESVLDRALAALPGVEFVQMYGMTELSPIATLLPPEYHTVAGRALGKIQSAGRATDIVTIRIVDEVGGEVACGVIGEVTVRGPNVMLGYWNRPEETASTLRDGWMYTGDAGYIDAEGFLFIVDRLKDMIISGGENVYSLEVENAIAAHPAVASVAVLGIPDAKWGEAVHAVVVLKSDESATVAQIQQYCKSLIAGYKCPRSIEFLDALPLTAAGKISKSNLRKRFWQNQGRQVS